MHLPSQLVKHFKHWTTSSCRWQTPGFKGLPQTKQKHSPCLSVSSMSEKSSAYPFPLTYYLGRGFFFFIGEYSDKILTSAAWIRLIRTKHCLLNRDWTNDLLWSSATCYGRNGDTNETVFLPDFLLLTLGLSCVMLSSKCTLQCLHFPSLIVPGAASEKYTMVMVQNGVSDPVYYGGDGDIRPLFLLTALFFCNIYFNPQPTNTSLIQMTRPWRFPPLPPEK